MTTNSNYEALEKKIAELEKKLYDTEQEKIKIQNELDKINLRLNFVLESVNQGIWDTDLKTGESYISPQLIALTGYKPEELVGFNNLRLFWSGIIFPEDHKYLFKNLREVYRGQKDRYDIEYRIQSKSGNLLWLLEHGSVINRDENGYPNRIAGITMSIDEKKNMEEILDESEEKFRILFETMLNGLILYEVVHDEHTDTIDYFLIEMNNTLERLTRISKRSLIDKSINHIFDGNYMFIEKLIETTYRTGVPQHLEFYDRMVNRYFDIYTHEPIETQVAISFVDITRRKIAENEFIKSKKLLQDIIDCAGNSVIYVKNLKGQYILINDLYEKLLNVNKENVYGKTVGEILPYEIAKASINEHIEVLTAKTLIKGEETLILNNTELTFLSTKFLLYDNSNQPYAICGILTDITDLKNIERKLDFERIKAQKYFDTVAVMLLVLDTEYKVIDINQIGCSFLEYNKSEILGQNWFFKFLPENSRNTILQTFESILNDDFVSNNYYECFVLTRNKTKKLIGWYNTVIKDESGKIISILSSGNDITELRRAEIELIKSKEKAEESDKLKTAFLANMSHEIRTPLNSIIGFTQILKKTASSQQQIDFLDIINKSGHHLLVLINDIIDVSKIEAGQIQISQTPCTLNTVLSDIYNFFENDIRINGLDAVTLIFNKKLENQSSRVYIDEIRLRQILTNLIGNAIKFTTKGYVDFGYIVTTYNGMPVIQFYVKDTGIGMPKEKQEIIFRRFVQADSGITRKFGGTGLGLAISRGLVELMGGKIWVESEKDKGSTFYFTIPYKPISEPDNYSSASNDLWDDNFDWSEKIILIVEDDYNNFLFLKTILKKTNANIVHVQTGNEAIEVCNSITNIDLILMDILLPGMSGYEATRIIKSMRNDIPVIAQTANAMPEDREKCVEAGCDDFIAKPIAYRDMMTKIKYWLYD